MENILTSYVIPLIAILASFLFWLNGRDSAKRAEHLLDEVTKTSRGWQKDIMDSANKMLNARPEVAAHQMFMAKVDAVNKLTDSRIFRVRVKLLNNVPKLFTLSFSIKPIIPV